MKRSSHHLHYETVMFFVYKVVPLVGGGSAPSTLYMLSEITKKNRHIFPPFVQYGSKTVVKLKDGFSMHSNLK